MRLYSRPNNDLTDRFPLIVETLARLHSRSCIIDGEAVACDDNGVASREGTKPADITDDDVSVNHDLIPRLPVLGVGAAPLYKVR